jgi:hypothetical protein
MGGLCDIILQWQGARRTLQQTNALLYQRCGKVCSQPVQDFVSLAQGLNIWPAGKSWLCMYVLGCGR